MCDYCEPWYDPKSLVETPRLMIRLKVMNGLDWFVQVLWKRGRKWYQIALESIDACPMCGRNLRRGNDGGIGNA